MNVKSQSKSMNEQVSCINCNTPIRFAVNTTEEERNKYGVDIVIIDGHEHEKMAWCDLVNPDFIRDIFPLDNKQKLLIRNRDDTVSKYSVGFVKNIIGIRCFDDVEDAVKTRCYDG